MHQWHMMPFQRLKTSTDMHSTQEQRGHLRTACAPRGTFGTYFPKPASKQPLFQTPPQNSLCPVVQCCPQPSLRTGQSTGVGRGGGGQFFVAFSTPCFGQFFVAFSTPRFECPSSLSAVLALVPPGVAPGFCGSVLLLRLSVGAPRCPVRTPTLVPPACPPVRGFHISV